MTSKTLFSTAPHKGWLPWGFLAPFLCIAFVIASVLIPSPWLTSLGLEDAEGGPIGLNGMYAYLVVAFALNGLMVLAWIWLVERRPLSTVGLTGPAPLATLFRGLLIGCVTISAVVASIGFAGGYQLAGFGQALSSPTALGSMALLLLCFAVQAGVEEFIFRGWLLSVVTRKWGQFAAVVVTTLVFNFLHWSPGQAWQDMLSIALFSVFACLWAIRAGNIWGVMGWHIGWNWLLSIGFGLPVTGFVIDLPALLVRLIPQGPDSLTGGAQGPEGSWICSLFFVIGILFLLRPRKA